MWVKWSVNRLASDETHRQVDYAVDQHERHDENQMSPLERDAVEDEIDKHYTSGCRMITIVQEELELSELGLIH